MKTIALLLCAWMLSGCALAFHNRLASAMEDSKIAYKACLEKSGECERERKAYEADLAALHAIGGGQAGGILFVAPIIPPTR